MKTAFITGGSKGIGYSMAETLIHNDWKVGITGRKAKAVEEAVTKLNAIKKGSAIGFVADVRNFDQQKDAVEKLLRTFGQLDALIANAGVGFFGPIETLEPKYWHDTIDTNLTGVFYSVKACYEALKKSKGYIITMGSLAGSNFFAGGSSYNASKFGLLGFTQAIMLDARAHEIKVSTIMPGSVATNFNDNIPSESDDWKIQPEDIGKIVLDMLQMNPRTLPSKIEVRPSSPAPKK